MDTAPSQRSSSICKPEERATYALIALMLLASVLGTASTAPAGDFNVNVGGINVAPQNNRLDSDQSRRIDRPQTSVGNISVPDAGRRSDNPQGGTSPLSDSRNLGGGPVIPSTNTGIGGTFQSGSTTLGQPSANQFCSNNEVTIGESTQGRVHCSNTVHGTFRQ
jgi:hypothetical protein